jgi:hypothetical protein
VSHIDNVGLVEKGVVDELGDKTTIWGIMFIRAITIDWPGSDDL